MINILKSLCFKAIINKIPILYKQISINNIEITETKSKKYGYFQLNNSMKLAKILNTTAIDIAEKIKNFIDNNTHNKFEKIEILAPGFVNFTLSQSFINKKLNIILKHKNLGIKQTNKKLTIIVDYSGPNIAKEMHVGHLRSTIIGECISKLLESIGHKVIRINHIGDWGTQFGMLIHYIKSNYENKENAKMTLNDLSKYYKNAQINFNTDEKFRNCSKNEVIKLQKEDKITINIWKKISAISKKEYNKIYKLLNVKLKTRGESSYKKLLIPIINKLTKKKLVTISNGAKCIYINGFKNKNNTPLPLIIQKSDGGFNYATTDLAALNYRINKQKANWIIYVTDIGQSTHFQMVFKTIEKANLNKHNSKITHLPFGMVLKTDGKKIKTRSGFSVSLKDLIITAVSKTKEIIKKRDPNLKTKELNYRSKVIGINTIKYADLSNNMRQDYKFDYEKMLKYNGNTATFLMYAYVRITSIKTIAENSKDAIDFFNTKLQITEETEIELGLHIIQFNYNIERAIKELNPNILTTYLYKLAEKFHTFFHKCKIINSENTKSRLLICDMTQKIIYQGMKILGLTAIEKL
ncbi:MAG: arginine--tRNA ligase [Enterobacteriaceae bacterium]|nr:arginine--tRNA ligase [Enterobacteriaceae bacterium]